MILITSILLILSLIYDSYCYVPTYLLTGTLHKYHWNYEGDNNKYCDKPLFLTPYIENGNIIYAQYLARIKPFKNINNNNNLISYSGYLTINKTCNSNLFFWFFKSSKINSPIILWLQGGPGSSFAFGLFNEIGPFFINNDNGELQLRNYTWTLFASILFIDNPVGTGFSFTDNNECLAKNQNDVRQDLYNGLIQFYKLFPKLEKNDFYIFGESYAGKYIPALAYSIHENNPISNIKINLKGLFIGNGLCDPINMLLYSKYLYQLGLIDEQKRDLLNNIEERTIEDIKNKKWKDASKKLNYIINKFIPQVTGNISVYNYLKMYNYNTENRIELFLNDTKTRCDIHTGNTNFSLFNYTVHSYFYEDMVKSVKPWIEILLQNNYKVVFYNGQLDLIVPYALTENYIKKLYWSGNNFYYNSSRYILNIYNDNKGINYDIAAYGKFIKNLNIILIRNAGHMVPSDQPYWTFSVIHSLLNDYIEFKSDIFNYKWTKIK